MDLLNILEKNFPTVMKLLPQNRRQKSNKQDSKQRETKQQSNANKYFEDVRKFLSTQSLLIKEKLSPLVNYYQGLNPREKILVMLAGIFIGIFLMYSFIFQPYLNLRNSIVEEYSIAFEEYKWLKSQEQRVNDLILANGGSFNRQFNVEELILKYAPNSKVELLESGEYLISSSSATGAGFFKSINVLINRGGELLAIEFARNSKQSPANFVARIKI